MLVGHYVCLFIVSNQVLSEHPSTFNTFALCSLINMFKSLHTWSLDRSPGHWRYTLWRYTPYRKPRSVFWQTLVTAGGTVWYRQGPMSFITGRGREINRKRGRCERTGCLVGVHLQLTKRKGFVGPFWGKYCKLIMKAYYSICDIYLSN